MAALSRDGRARERVSESRQWVTVLFTDIADSTRHWNEQGDVEARLQVENHDSLLAAVVREFHGTLVKTIGDSLMVTFVNADNAVRAAIAMQHQLEEARQKDPDFDLSIRIGLHRGVALVEENDVYGSTVNVASRVESRAEGGEILMTDAVATEVDRDAYQLKRVGSFTPKGKSVSILLYRVSWWRDESRIGPVAASAPKAKRRAGPSYLNSLVWLPFGLIGVAGVAMRFLPSLLVGHPGWASLLLNPTLALTDFASEVSLAAGALVVISSVALSIRWTRGLAAAALRGSATLCLVGLGLYACIQALPASLGWPAVGNFIAWQPADTSWVEVGDGEPGLALVYDEASDSAKLLATLRPGERYVLERTSSDGTSRWLQVHLAPGRRGWLSQGPDPEAPIHSIAPADAIEVGDAEVVALGCAMLTALGAVLAGRSRGARRRE